LKSFSARKEEGKEKKGGKASPDNASKFRLGDGRGEGGIGKGGIPF